LRADPLAWTRSVGKTARVRRRVVGSWARGSNAASWLCHFTLRRAHSERYHCGMLAKLTLRMAALPEQTWPRFAAAHAQAEPLPSPRKHVAGVALVSVLGTGIGWLILPGSTAGGAVLQMLAAVVGYVGGAALAVELSPRLIQAPGITPDDVSRFASGAVLPIAVSGAFNVIPLLPMNFVLALAGTAASAQSGWIGASAMLALEGPARTRAAAIPAGVALGAVLLTTIIRMVLPR
jgi:hypothetical protein